MPLHCKKLLQPVAVANVKLPANLHARLPALLVTKFVRKNSIAIDPFAGHPGKGVCLLSAASSQ